MRYQNYKTVLLRRRCKEYQINETKQVFHDIKCFMQKLSCNIKNNFIFQIYTKSTHTLHTNIYFQLIREPYYIILIKRLNFKK